MEKVIQCTVCEDTNHCFEEVQEDYSSFMCFKCGFMSDTRFSNDHDKESEQNMSLLMNQIKVFDQARRIWWYPSVVNMGKLGMIFPEGSSKYQWQWKFAKVVPVEEGDTEAEGYKEKLDIENAKAYNKTDFLSAIKEMGITKDLRSAKD